MAILINSNLLRARRKTSVTDTGRESRHHEGQHFRVQERQVQTNRA